MRFRFAAVALLAVLAAGCGGSGSSSSGAADLVPPDALAYITLNTDLGSSQDQNAVAILNKFPIKATLLAQIRKQVSSSGVDLDALKRSVGPEVDIAILTVAGKTTAVGFTQPKDEKTFDQQLDAGTSTHPVHTTINGWTVFTKDQSALDAVRNRSGKLSDEQGFKDATGSVPSAGDALATAYVARSAIEQGASALGSQGGLSTGSLGLEQAKWVAAAATSHDAGVELEVHANGLGGSSPNQGSTLVDQIPSGALAVLSFGNADSLLTKLSSTVPAGTLGIATTALGVSLQDIGRALGGQTILFVRAGTPIPEATLASLPSDPQAALTTVGTLISKVTKGATPQATTIGGFAFHKVSLGPVDILYGLMNKELVVTDSTNAVAELQAKDNRLSSAENTGAEERRLSLSVAERPARRSRRRSTRT